MPKLSLVPSVQTDGPTATSFDRKLQLVREAAALEDAGGFWTQAQAAAVLNLSVSTLRASSCPKLPLHARGHGRRAMVHYEPAAVRAWRATGGRCATQPQTRVG